MTGYSKLFSSYSVCVGNQKIKIADGSLSTIAGKGSIAISKSLVLHNVLHVLNLLCNLLSISKLTCDLKCCAKFLPTHCEFQEMEPGRMIGSAKENGGLYYFEDRSNSCGQAQFSSLQSLSISRSDELKLWHLR